MCLLTILHQCTEAVQCKHSLPVILTEDKKKFNLRFDSRQSRTGHPQSKILATPMSCNPACTDLVMNLIKATPTIVGEAFIFYL